LQQIRRDCAWSEREEVRIFFRKAREFYRTANVEGEELYDIAFRLTNEFRNITGQVIRQNSRILKILRYMLLPTLSQMKLGQMVGLASTASFENGVVPNSAIAQRLATMVRHNLDRGRIVWQQARMSPKERAVAQRYAKRWTASLMANQNSATDFRNWRKDIQENKIEGAIMEASFRLLPNRPVVREIGSLPPGAFVKESKIGRRNPQKADFVIRTKDGRRLIALEAKAIGVRIDAYKRVKEVRDKAAAWNRLFGSRIQTGAVIAGFIPVGEVGTLSEARIPFFWEHDLGRLTSYLRRL